MVRNTTYRDVKHVEEVMKAMEGDKGANELYKEAMKLITPGSIVFGDFSRLKEIPRIRIRT
jgi:hypothetical protein